MAKLSKYDIEYYKGLIANGNGESEDLSKFADFLGQEYQDLSSENKKLAVGLAKKLGAILVNKNPKKSQSFLFSSSGNYAGNDLGHFLYRAAKHFTLTEFKELLSGIKADKDVWREALSSLEFFIKDELEGKATENETQSKGDRVLHAKFQLVRQKLGVHDKYKSGVTKITGLGKTQTGGELTVEQLAELKKLRLQNS